MIVRVRSTLSVVVVPYPFYLRPSIPTMFPLSSSSSSSSHQSFELFVPVVRLIRNVIKKNTVHHSPSSASSEAGTVRSSLR